ncbi:hypothetical protein EMCRGX_G028149 [Ephydatia muelleri]
MDIDHQSQADNYNDDDDDSEPTGDNGNSYEEDSDGTVYHDDEIIETFKELRQSNYYPFPSKIFALLFFLVNSPHPVGDRNLTFFWFILKQLGIKTPSLGSVKRFKFSDMELPERYWCNDPRFSSPMATLVNGTSVFVRDCVYFYHSILGTTKGKIVRFFHKVGCKCFCKYAGTYGIHHQSGCDGVFAGIEMLLDCPQFRQMVPESVIYYLDPDSLILYDYIEVPLSSILGITACPQIIVRWASSQFSRMDLQAAGKPIVMLPLILFSDDLSGNKSKKWHKFDAWYMSLAGLPRCLHTKLQNINFICCSDSVAPLDLSSPIAEQLTALEQEGVEVFDAFLQQMVLVMAPLICIACDNPRASELLNHLGSSQTTTLGALQHDSQFDIRLEELTTSDTVQEFKAVISKDSTLVNLGEFIELVNPYDQVHAAAAPILVELTCCIIPLDAVWTSSSYFQHFFWHHTLSCSGLPLL